MLKRLIPLTTIILGLLFTTGCNNISSKLNQATVNQIKIKVVVVTMFEIGQDEGDRAGEFQLWKEGQNLDTCMPFEVSYHDICLNPETGVLGIVTGMGIAKATSAILALGLDERFDLAQAYWLVAGIAGIDPADASIGSAAWANYLVDGDLAHQIDAREMPKEWNTGYFPLFDIKPLPKGESIDLTKPNRHNQSTNGEVYKLNTKLTNWAYELTQNLILPDYPEMKELRSKYKGFPNAQKPPFVLVGDQLAASTFWHGEKLNDWANDWVYYWSGGKGNFVTSGMEDTGSYQAMIYLDNVGKVDKSRFMVLRTGSNYSMQPSGLTPHQNLTLESKGYAGMRGALESAYLVGSTVVNNIIANWDKYQSELPYEVIDGK